MLASVGLGAVASVGFSVVSDLISPRRRGLVMSLWGLSQAHRRAGRHPARRAARRRWNGPAQSTGAGPFLLLAGLGVVAILAYLFTYDIRRGQSEPELAALFAAGGDYEHRIDRGDLRGILGRRTNVWLILQGLTAQATFGSLVWLPRLLQAKAEHAGVPEPDRRSAACSPCSSSSAGCSRSSAGWSATGCSGAPRGGRALVAAFGILAGIPFYVVLFFVPLKVDVPAGASTGRTVLAVLSSVVTEPTVAIAFLAALVALALTSANSPNWFALLADVNPPEHRGTVLQHGQPGQRRRAGRRATGWSAWCSGR